MKTRITICCAAFVTLLTAHRSAQAGYVVTLEQLGPNVVATGSGALDPTPLGFTGPVNTGGSDAFMEPRAAVMIIGPSGNADLYGFNLFGAQMVGPSSFGSRDSIITADSSSGDFVGLNASGALDVPTGYVSGSPLADTATWNNQTLSSLGVTPGIYEWTWGNGADQNYTLQIGEVPEPATWGAGALLALGLFSHFVQRRRLA
jgi:PEP-CTERM motif